MPGVGITLNSLYINQRQWCVLSSALDDSGWELMRRMITGLSSSRSGRR